jgi:hypothetical protein
MLEKKSSQTPHSKHDRARIEAILSETPVLRPKVLKEEMTLAEVKHNLLREQKTLIRDLEAAGVKGGLIRFDCILIWILGIPFYLCTITIRENRLA